MDPRRSFTHTARSVSLSFSFFFSLSTHATFSEKISHGANLTSFLSPFSIFGVRGTYLFIYTWILNRDHRTSSRNAKDDELNQVPGWGHLTRRSDHLLTHKSSRAATSPGTPSLLSGTHYDGLHRLTQGSVSPRGHRFGSSCRPQATCPLSSPKFSENNQINRRQTWGEVGTVSRLAAEPPPVQRK